MTLLNQARTIVRLDGVEFAYPDRLGIPRSFIPIPDLTVQDGEHWMIVGPSGSGKSTLLNLISGELIPQSGTVEVLGQAVHDLSFAKRQSFRIANIGYVFQDFPLVPYLNVLQNVVLPYRVNPELALTTACFDRAHTLLERLGLYNKDKRMPSELSQGERQRVAIARALIAKPRLILADEPTAGLDLKRSHGVLDLIENIATDEGAGLIVVSHEPQIVERFTHVLALEGE